MNAPRPPVRASRTALRWESARAESRQRILHAAGEVFTEDGFESATMKRIAEVCGITKVTIYAHYRDKERLYRAVMDGYLGSMPKPALEMRREVGLRDALACIVQDIRILAGDPSCQAFCQILLRSDMQKSAYMDRWNEVLQPYRESAVRAFSDVSPKLNNGEDGEKFLRLILAEQGLPKGTAPVSGSNATIELFTRSYGYASLG